MKKDFLQKIKQRLEKEKASIKKLLSGFAKEDKKLKGDWDTIYPSFDGEAGSASLERAADEVEEYERLLPVEHALETKLRDINLALERIKKGKYGICEKCGRKISQKRLKVSPEARVCLKCQK